MEPKQENRRVVDTTFEVATERDVVMVDVEARCENAAQVEEEKDCPEVARESGIARALIAVRRGLSRSRIGLRRRLAAKRLSWGRL